ncbi:hypothetical protein [Fimbriiglobus ruber]|uniref:RNA-binding protein n=1 Tax=Fimbriiglobus ruber TaxID=1908690 RepID=A0A225DB73_9BACT|nr:hypothetical protein [Fimbriiglobus ruber]OWK38233.1 RNA-binding protein [Fimbriiglobus ruber]
MLRFMWTAAVIAAGVGFGGRAAAADDETIPLGRFKPGTGGFAGAVESTAAKDNDPSTKGDTELLHGGGGHGGGGHGGGGFHGGGYGGFHGGYGGYGGYRGYGYGGWGGYRGYGWGGYGYRGYGYGGFGYGLGYGLGFGLGYGLYNPWYYGGYGGYGGYGRYGYGGYGGYGGGYGGYGGGYGGYYSSVVSPVGYSAGICSVAGTPASPVSIAPVVAIDLGAAEPGAKVTVPDVRSEPTQLAATPPAKIDPVDDTKEVKISVPVVKKGFKYAAYGVK